jgi:hypothetical protein
VADLAPVEARAAGQGIRRTRRRPRDRGGVRRQVHRADRTAPATQGAQPPPPHRLEPVAVGAVRQVDGERERRLGRDPGHRRQLGTARRRGRPQAATTATAAVPRHRTIARIQRALELASRCRIVRVPRHAARAQCRDGDEDVIPELGEIAPTTLAGVYQVTGGTTVRGRRAGGTVVVTPVTGRLFKVTREDGHDRAAGIGIWSAPDLVVAWSRDDYRAAVYQRGDDGRLRGAWADPSTLGRLGYERGDPASRRPDASVTGSWDLFGRSGDDHAYTATLAVDDGAGGALTARVIERGARREGTERLVRRADPAAPPRTP